MADARSLVLWRSTGQCGGRGWVRQRRRAAVARAAAGNSLCPCCVPPPQYGIEPCCLHMPLPSSPGLLVQAGQQAKGVSAAAVLPCAPLWGHSEAECAALAVGVSMGASNRDKFHITVVTLESPAPPAPQPHFAAAGAPGAAAVAAGRNPHQRQQRGSGAAGCRGPKNREQPRRRVPFGVAAAAGAAAASCCRPARPPAAAADANVDRH